MSLYLSREDVRAIDRRAEADGLPTRVLMENAGRGVADVVVGLGSSGRILVCCGKGNNGGDGFVAARHLASRGFDVRTLLFASPEDLTGAAAENWFALNRAGAFVDVLWPFDEARFAGELERAACAIDALFGIGLTAAPRPPFDRIISMLNGSGLPIVAVDVPSGLDADTGEPLGAVVRALRTVTFVAPKRGFANPHSTEWTGQIDVVDLGLIVGHVSDESDRAR